MRRFRVSEVRYAAAALLVGTPEEYIKAMGDSPVKIHNRKPGDTLEF